MAIRGNQRLRKRLVEAGVVPGLIALLKSVVTVLYQSHAASLLHQQHLEQQQQIIEPPRDQVTPPNTDDNGENEITGNSQSPGKTSPLPAETGDEIPPAAEPSIRAPIVDATMAEETGSIVNEAGDTTITMNDSGSIVNDGIALLFITSGDVIMDTRSLLEVVAVDEPMQVIEAPTAGISSYLYFQNHSSIHSSLLLWTLPYHHHAQNHPLQ